MDILDTWYARMLRVDIRMFQWRILVIFLILVCCSYEYQTLAIDIDQKEET